MQKSVRTVLHGAVLAVVAGVSLAVVLGGSFDVVSLPGAAPAAVPSAPVPATEGGATTGSGDGAGDPAGDGAATGPSVPADPAAGDGTDAPPVATTDPVCHDAEVAWGASAKAQVNLSVEHPETLVEGFTTARDALTGVTPPDEIARDWAVVRTYLTMIADEVEATGASDTGELTRAIDRVGRRIDTAALTASSQRVTEYFRAGCVR